MNNKFEQPLCTHCHSRLNSVFKNLEGDLVQQMSTAKACRMYTKGDIIFGENEQPSGLYCVHSGKIKVYKIGDEGRHQIVRFAKAGDAIGYRSLVSGEPYNLSAAALEESAVCCIPASSFFDLLRSSREFSMDMLHLVAGQLRRAEDKLVNLAQKPVRERLAEALLILKEVYGTENGESSAINVALTRDELAAVVGTATETLVRTIADFKRENLIATDKKKIKILDVDGLIVAGNLQD
jgi:CRP/FNR family transcriptional regulator